MGAVNCEGRIGEASWFKASSKAESEEVQGTSGS